LSFATGVINPIYWGFIASFEILKDVKGIDHA
jgi:hypothetical protein